jgi:hypothetical protein
MKSIEEIKEMIAYEDKYGRTGVHDLLNICDYTLEHVKALNEQIAAIGARLDKLENNRTIGPIKDLARSKPEAVPFGHRKIATK